MTERFDDATLLDGANQFRIRRLQVFNWGTFSNIHDIPMSDGKAFPEKGFLFVGPSGSGKSTLLDAMISLLYPNPNYNAAAREGDGRRGDRTLLSYVRGAWSTQADADAPGSPRARVQYLRPGATFSAAALTFCDRTGIVLTLMLVAYVRKSTQDEAGVNRRYYLIEGDYSFNPYDFEGFARRSFDWRWLRERLPKHESWERSNAFREAFCRRMGIRDQAALVLLSKAQSAKNLGDLNQFLRNFMLEEPPTRELADRLVDEFNQLDDAHKAVVKARDQVAHLEEAKRRHEAMLAARERSLRLAEEADARPVWRARTELAWAQAALPKLEGAAAEAKVRRDAAQKRRADADARVKELERRRWESGGSRLERLEADARAAERALAETRRRAGGLAPAVKAAGADFPETAEAWAELAGRMQTMLSSLADAEAKRRSERDELVAQERALSERFRETAAEIEALRSHPSNIPARQLALREALAAALGLPEERLPFAGELIQVKPEEAAWQGAIERVLHSFSLSILVADRDYEALSALVNSRHLGERLVYFRVRGDERRRTEAPAGTIPEKLDIKDGPWAAWLAGELAERFDYLCAEDLDEFRVSKKAVTQAGQVKHSAVRHEKDDRTRVDDCRHWVTGFSSQEKLAAFEEDAAQQAANLSALQRRIRALEEEGAAARRAADAATLIVHANWSDLDEKSAEARLADVEAALAEIRSKSSELAALDSEIAQAKTDLGGAQAALDEAGSALKMAEHRAAQGAERVKALAAREAQERRRLDEARRPLTDAGLAAAADRIEKEAKRAKTALSPDTLPDLYDAASKRCAEEKNAADVAAERELGAVVRGFEEFNSKWPEADEELEPKIESAVDYFRLLEKIVEDGLPKYEAKFRELLRSQSLQDFAELSTTIQSARRRIIDRMADVNASLAAVPFSRLSDGSSSHLRIEVRNLRIPDVEEFMNDLGALISGAMDDMPPEEEERRFGKIQALVEKLNPAKPEHERWRRTVLDVRNHVNFTAYELAADGTVIETYFSGSGKSGGQRQKLTTTCLAAALRYQLGSSEAGLPAYAPVILDEAFDKADSEFTDLSMNIFLSFGFQMIVATPMKSVTTLEPYVGGAYYVTMAGRRSSSGLLVRYDAKKSKLAFDELPEGGVPEGKPAHQAAAAPDGEGSNTAGEAKAEKPEAEAPAKATEAEEAPRPPEPSLFG